MILSNQSIGQLSGVFESQPAAQDRLKRGLNILLADSALAFFFSILMLVAVLIEIDSRGLVFFHQERSGLNGRAFTTLKFRYMHLHENDVRVIKARRDDDEIVATGRLIRKSSIDELPQLVNVREGDMSIVGPHPHALARDALFGVFIGKYQLRSRVRPGVIGLAQVEGLQGGANAVGAMAARADAVNVYIGRWPSGDDMRILLMAAHIS